MIVLGRSVAAFSLLMVVGYVAVVAFFPAPPTSSWRPDEMSGTSAAARLSQEAQSLVSHKPAGALQ